MFGFIGMALSVITEDKKVFEKRLIYARMIAAYMAYYGFLAKILPRSAVMLQYLGKRSMYHD